MTFFSRPLTVASTLAPAARPAPGRWIDPRAQRLGAALSGGTLVIAYLLGSWLLVAAVGVALAVSAFFGTRWFAFSRPWPLVRRWLDLGMSELEHELPPRFAQAMGATFLAAGTILLALGVTPLGWLPVAAVVALQMLLATSGFCLGCRLFFLRWYVPDLFARLVGRGVRRESLIILDLPPHRP
ncbi:MAG TPA: DUF4395 domain-containing protein [Candidatus Limnocylindria bacterium]|nr:DUF4395 domain-containing protein [Candidatus Limnocylindria bacterium]